MAATSHASQPSRRVDSGDSGVPSSRVAAGALGWSLSGSPTQTPAVAVGGGQRSVAVAR